MSERKPWELSEREPDNAPPHMSVTEAQAWANGYNTGVTEAVKKVVRHLPLTRTTIGPERSMPEGTEIWFITGEEWQALRGWAEEE